MGACASVSKAMRAEAMAPAPEQPKEEEELVAVAHDAKVAEEVKPGDEKLVEANDGEVESRSLGSLLQEADEVKKEDKKVEQPQQPEVVTPAQPAASEPEIKEAPKAEEVQAAPIDAQVEEVKISQEVAAGVTAN